MKKIFLIFILLILNINIVFASDKIEVTLNKCVDGDTAWFNLNDERIKVRFLAIDTPESTNKQEPYGKEANKFTCDNLKNAKLIEIEYDEKSDKTDKYGRHLAWIFVDNKLLQEKIVENGYAEVKYLYGDYKYTNILKESEQTAKKYKLGIWSNSENINPYLLLIVIILFILIYIFNSKTRKKINQKMKDKIKKEINKKIDDII